MRLRSTPAREDEADWLWPHENDDGQWETRYGGGFSLTRCRGRAASSGCAGASRAERPPPVALRRRARLRRATSRSTRAGASRSGGRRRATFAGQPCDFCVRGYSHGVYARGQDSAGFLVFEQCSKNEFRDEQRDALGRRVLPLRRERDAQEDRDRRVQRQRGRRQRLLARGRERHRGDVLRRATGSSATGCDDCDHGVWAGYSYDTRISGNTFRRLRERRVDRARAAQPDRGQRVHEVREAIHLWTDEDTDLKASPFGRARDTVSRANSDRARRLRGVRHRDRPRRRRRVDDRPRPGRRLQGGARNAR